MKQWLICIGILCSVFTGWAQEKKQPVPNRQDAKKAVLEISSSMERNMPADTLAANYTTAAYSFLLQSDTVRAEEYLSRASIYHMSAGESEQSAYLEREIGRLREGRGRVQEAIRNYGLAADRTLDTSFRRLNMNDIQRLQGGADPVQSVSLIQSNISLMKGPEQNVQRSQAYRQIAQNQMQMDQPEEALGNLQAALDEVQEEPLEAIQIEQQMAEVLAASDQVEEAIGLNQRILETAKQESNSQLQIEQLQKLSGNYVQTSDPEKAKESLLEAYEIALRDGHMLDAKRSVELLAEQYRSQRKTQQALELYAGFLEHLEPLVRADSTLIDERFFLAHEERIARMEKERELQDILIRKQYTFNNVLLVCVLVIFLFLLFIVRTLVAIKKKNKKIALQSLRREMNPHFIFNSLNSVNQFIAQNQEMEANRYLSSYSRLMRNMMEHSNEDFIPLSTEVEQLQKYLELEQMRFPEKFTYELTVDEALDADALRIPNMLIQPQVENAVWHGLRYRETGGLLQVRFVKKDEGVEVTVEDNGIGLQKSRELKTEHQRSRQSRGQLNTIERIELLNGLYQGRIRMEIIDKQGEESGVIVRFYFPFRQQKHKQQKPK